MCSPIKDKLHFRALLKNQSSVEVKKTDTKIAAYVVCKNRYYQKIAVFLRATKSYFKFTLEQ